MLQNKARAIPLLGIFQNDFLSMPWDSKMLNSPDIIFFKTKTRNVEFLTAEATAR